MFIFASEYNRYQRTGLWLWLAMLSLYAAGFPPFQTGIWVQMEPILTATLTLGTLGALWLAYGVHKKYLIAVKPHPLFLALVAWVVWQCIVYVLAGMPWRGWFGPTENDDGTVLSLAGLIMFMVVYPLWQKEAFRGIILKVAIAGVLLLCMLHWANPDDVKQAQPWRPSKWPDYLAFMAGSLWIAALTNKLPKTHPGLLCGFVVLTFIILYSSQNMSATLLIGSAMVCTVIIEGIARFRGARRVFYPGKVWFLLAMLGCLVPALIAPLSDRVPVFNNTVDRGSVQGDVFDSESSIGSRVVHMQIALSTMRHEPERLWLGTSWGRFSDDMFKYALVNNAGAFINGEPDPYTNWLIFGSAFNTHNQPLEALISVGVLGMMLWYAIPLVAIAYLPRRMFWVAVPMIVALTFSSHIWFLLPQNIPFHMLGWAAVATVSSRRVHWARFKMPALGLALLAAVMATSLCYQYKVMMEGDRLVRAMLWKDYADFPQEILDEDLKRGGERMYLSTDYLLQYLNGRTQTGGMVPNDIGWFNMFLTHVHAGAMAPKANARLVALDIFMLNNLYFAFDNTPMTMLKEHYKPVFTEAVIRLAELAPEREDFACRYLVEIARFTDGKPDFERRTLEAILAAAPNHRSALWLLGQLYRKDSDPVLQARGFVMMKRAADLGVSRVYPVTDAELVEFK